MKYLAHVTERNLIFYRKHGVQPKWIHSILSRKMSHMKLFNYYYECSLGIQKNESASVKHLVETSNDIGMHFFSFSFFRFVLEHSYIHEGRIRYHSCMCRCCFSTPNGRQYTVNLEPVRGFRYDDSDENFCSMRQAKGELHSFSFHDKKKADFSLEYMHKLLTEFSQANTVPLRLNHDSPLYKTFATWVR